MQVDIDMDLDRMPADVRSEYQRFKRGMSPTHLLIAEWIIQNPGGTYAQMGAFFNYSPSWLCTLCNSDMFKAHLATRVKDIQSVVTQDVPEKMRVLANISCDKMMEVLENTSDPEVVVDSFDKIMHRYGYAPNAKNGAQAQGTHIGQQNNVFFLNKEDFQKVQGKLINSHAEQLPAPQLESAKEDGADAVPANAEKV